MSDEKLSPRAALEALGFVFRPTMPRRIDVVAPGPVAVSWGARSGWPDSDSAREYVLGLLREAEQRAASARALADSFERQARDAEAQAAKTRDVVGRMR